MKQVRKEEKKMKKEAFTQQRVFDPDYLREQRLGHKQFITMTI